jgi:hypothetical protein
MYLLSGLPYAETATKENKLMAAPHNEADYVEEDSAKIDENDESADLCKIQTLTPAANPALALYVYITLRAAEKVNASRGADHMIGSAGSSAQAVSVSASHCNSVKAPPPGHSGKYYEAFPRSSGDLLDDLTIW